MLFPQGLAEFFSNLGDIGVTTIVLGIAAFWLFVRQSRIAGTSLLLVSLSCMGLTALLKLYFWERHGMPELGLTEAAPSGHTSVNIVTYCGIAGILLANYGRGTKLASVVFCLLGVTIALSRISDLGHSPEDVLLGMFLGGIGAVAIYALSLHEERRFDATLLGIVTVVALVIVWGSGFRFDADEAFHKTAAHLIG